MDMETEKDREDMLDRSFLLEIGDGMYGLSNDQWMNEGLVRQGKDGTTERRKSIFTCLLWSSLVF